MARRSENTDHTQQAWQRGCRGTAGCWPCPEPLGSGTHFSSGRPLATPSLWVLPSWLPWGSHCLQQVICHPQGLTPNCTRVGASTPPPCWGDQPAPGTTSRSLGGAAAQWGALSLQLCAVVQTQPLDSGMFSVRSGHFLAVGPGVPCPLFPLSVSSLLPMAAV